MNLKKLYEEVKQTVDINKIHVFVVGNKNDMYNEEKVTKQEANDYSRTINATLRIVSALSANGIKELFDCVGEALLTNKTNEPPAEEAEQNKDNIVLDNKNNKKKDNKDNKQKKKCC